MLTSELVLVSLFDSMFCIFYVCVSWHRRPLFHGVLNFVPTTLDHTWYMWFHTTVVRCLIHPVPESLLVGSISLSMKLWYCIDFRCFENLPKSQWSHRSNFARDLDRFSNYLSSRSSLIPLYINSSISWLTPVRSHVSLMSFSNLPFHVFRSGSSRSRKCLRSSWYAKHCKVGRAAMVIILFDK